MNSFSKRIVVAAPVVPTIHGGFVTHPASHVDPSVFLPIHHGEPFGLLTSHVIGPPPLTTWPFYPWKYYPYPPYTFW